MPYAIVLEEISRNGKQTGRYHIIEDQHHGDYSKGFLSMQQFVIDLRIRYARLFKTALEELSCIPSIVFFKDYHTLLDDHEDVTTELLPEVILYVEEYLGEIKYSQTCTKQQRAVQEYLQKVGVEIL